MTYRIALVCLGNICRSPIAHVVLEHRLAEAGLGEQVQVVSSSTGGLSARRVEFWPASGRVRQRLVAVDNAPQDVRRPAPAPMPAESNGDVDLF